MPRVVYHWGRALGGDCHLLAQAVMLDLADAGAQQGWTWRIEDCRRNALGWHSFNMCDGWCYDFSNGHHHAVLVMRIAAYAAIRDMRAYLSVSPGGRGQ